MTHHEGNDLLEQQFQYTDGIEVARHAILDIAANGEVWVGYSLASEAAARANVPVAQAQTAQDELVGAGSLVIRSGNAFLNLESTEL